MFSNRKHVFGMPCFLTKLSSYIKLTTCLTAQHRETINQVLIHFNVNPDYDLNIMTKNQPLTDLSIHLLTKMDELLKKIKPDIILVHGDSSTTFIASLAAFYNCIPVGQVEAGLRTFDKFSSSLEKLNKQLTDIIADLHFAPTELAAKNLIKENKPTKSIFITGNTIIDTLNMTLDKNYYHPVFNSVKNKKLILLTIHRKENLNKIDEIFNVIQKIIHKFQDVIILYPVPLNPEIQKKAKFFLGNQERIIFTSPLSIYDFHNLIAKSYLILTDSRGIQEKAPSLNVPVVILGNATERPEGLETGASVLVGTKPDNIYTKVYDLLTNPVVYKEMSNAINPYGNGNASEKIIRIILKYLGI
ncbi:non-hydrolyzing UDP-N-acetylglucosamine 2-epimerase [Bacillus thuringiensis]|uniref:non-hydrolyzing UDP-N-acetylglucosamine 2-epimerase n=1 Tax=Bacillus thuringiensis TaxID=1428 RepID=UPI0018CD5432|nr:UDP-N-acetylglucosamine 2-epimerase (non-hydrolyzing) [Bacillus thuringiensis]